MTPNTDTTAASGAASHPFAWASDGGSITFDEHTAKQRGYRPLVFADDLPSAPAAPAAQEAEPAPIDMVLHCPACGLQHIDAKVPGAMVRVPTSLGLTGMATSFQWKAGWDNQPHRSHLCHGCGHTWRPADVPTNGVAEIKTKGKADSPIATPAPRPQADAGAVAVPEGWRLVPVEPTSEMLAAQEAEPVATVQSYSSGSYWRNYKLEWHRDVPEGTKLYAHPPRPQADAGAVTDWDALRHSANEWADMATNGLQWMRNVVDGTSDPKDALTNLERNLAHCRAVNDAPSVQSAVRVAAAPQAPAAPDMESVLIDGVAYQTPAPVAAELLRLHLEAMEAPAAPTAAAALPLAITSAPSHIWLDLGFDLQEEDTHFSELHEHEITWSKDNATGFGIKYVRADMAAAPAPAAGAAPTDATWWRKRADVIEMVVARSGSTEAMRCFTDMRALLQAATLGAAAPAQEAEDAAPDAGENVPVPRIYINRYCHAGMCLASDKEHEADCPKFAARARQEGQA